MNYKHLCSQFCHLWNTDISHVQMSTKNQPFCYPGSKEAATFSLLAFCICIWEGLGLMGITPSW